MSPKFVPKGPINNILALVQIIDRRRPGDEPLPEAILVSILTQIIVTRHHWVNIKSLALIIMPCLLFTKEVSGIIVITRPSCFVTRIVWWDLIFGRKSEYCTVKPVGNDHLYNKINYLGFIQQCVLMKTEVTILLVLTMSAFWSSSRWPSAT